MASSAKAGEALSSRTVAHVSTGRSALLIEGSLGAVCDAVDTVFQPGSSARKRAFVAVRPPGHHCSADYRSGFCWINNVHVCIMHAIQGGLVLLRLIEDASVAQNVRVRPVHACHTTRWLEPDWDGDVKEPSSRLLGSAGGDGGEEHGDSAEMHAEAEAEAEAEVERLEIERTHVQARF